MKTLADNVLDVLQEKGVSSSMRYIINGDPIALARPRFGKTHTYDSQKQLKLIAGITLTSQHGERPLFTGPLHLHMDFYLNYSSKTKTKMDNTPHVRVPDLDNLIKFICDLSSGILFHDDRIVAQITARKWFSHTPRTELTVSEI